MPTFLSPPAGSLTAPGPLAGTQSVSFSAADTGSGLSNATLEVDGRTVATQDFGCPPPYVHLVPCKLANGGTLSIDTATLADGTHSARVLATDATGANVGVAGPFTFTTANTPTACAPEAASTFTVRLDPRGTTFAYGAKVSVSGTLGGVAAGTPVLVASQVGLTGAPAKLGRTPLLVDAAGRFTYRIPAGPSRTLALRPARPRAAQLRMLEAADGQRQGALEPDESRRARSVRAGACASPASCRAGMCPRAAS